MAPRWLHLVYYKMNVIVNLIIFQKAVIILPKGLSLAVICTQG